jgi:hypothetical protein
MTLFSDRLAPLVMQLFCSGWCGASTLSGAYGLRWSR